MEPDDLLPRLKSGDATAWRGVFGEHGPRLLAYATRMVGNRAMAEEVVQDALVTVYRGIDRFDGRCSVKSWLYRAVHNRAIDELRRVKRFVDVGEDPERGLFTEKGRWAQPLPDWGLDADARLDARRLLEVVQVEIEKLPHAHREVLLLKEVDGLSTAEICEALEITPGNLRVRLHRARRALRAAVGRIVEEV